MAGLWLPVAETPFFSQQKRYVQGLTLFINVLFPRDENQARNNPIIDGENTEAMMNPWFWFLTSLLKNYMPSLYPILQTIKFIHRFYFILHIELPVNFGQMLFYRFSLNAQLQSDFFV